ncbi:hypothetical protein STAS_18468, partial [Striga asiatica]
HFAPFADCSHTIHCCSPGHGRRGAALHCFNRLPQSQSGRQIPRIFLHSHRYAASDTVRCRKSRGWSSAVTCSAPNGPSSPDISSTAKIRSEVLSPFRSLGMFFYLAFVASGSLGGLIAFSQLIGALSNPSRAAQLPELLNGLGIDLGAVSIFAFLYYRDNNAKNAQLARLSREESLSSFKLRVDEKRILPLSAFRGIALVILAGPASFIEESFRLSEPFSAGLIERGVLVVLLATDGNLPDFEFQETGEIDVKRKRLWQLTPVLAPEWNKWLDEQKKLANVSPESPRALAPVVDKFTARLVMKRLNQEPSVIVDHLLVENYGALPADSHHSDFLSKLHRKMEHEEGYSNDDDVSTLNKPSNHVNL